jgi:competence protein ComEA
MNDNFCKLRVAVFVAVLICGPVATLLAQTAPQASSSATTVKGPVQSAKPTTKVPASKLIDINSATVEQLKTLPGINDTLAQKIVQGRPYRVKTELARKNIVSQAVYNKISGLVIAKQTTAPKPQATTQNAPTK